MAGGSAPKPDTAITLSISKLAGLLGVKPALLRDILGTTSVELRDQPKIVAGGIDNERDMGFWTFFNNIGSIPTLNLPRECYLIDLRRKCLNGAVNAGGHTLLIEPAANSVVILHYLSSVNLDVLGVNHVCNIRTAGGAYVGDFWSITPLAAASAAVFPRNASGAGNFDRLSNFILTDAFEVIMTTASVDVAEDTDFYMLYTYIGDAPTITETGPAGSVFSDVP